MLIESRVRAILGRRMHQELVSEWRIQVYPSRVSIHAHMAMIARRTIHLKSGAAQCCALYTPLIDQLGAGDLGVILTWIITFPTLALGDGDR